MLSRFVRRRILAFGVVTLAAIGITSCSGDTGSGQAPPAQMLGYQLALLRGLDPDKPRNLAKSVTVK